ncbi:MULTISPECIES: quinone-dependent dihydroorotate dehydrogenase [unclassified Paracoccus (in: a-proteobacteria)]|uniref:quinone-dependent dihydroorotate dehydrogenase n=1 Tax=unclassified Paracoccus (in: a-proteobacteria) TaxID=2688777 RepID=UPI0016045061|nr:MULTISPECIES: quinone-dependent dihydroorotate dehydrogenase [unclassified Paracoccus (in: a-proteobacteria)]MBB1490669.1 quinone-dependent dihydroorotate dehydrogenase [Paracoccus sp. MC1854]MBB1497488.1 quinone-dependent dihydroorotate dehydrogenase [Paracoccus sp. MC1862]QQO45962.1 quinone-dependent dihydroorotate dehydrogenase [Paracoccus sp. MC1862]
MRLIERAGLAALHRLDPERAHDLSLKALATGLVPLPGQPFTSPRLETRVAGLNMPNPVGLAAGYDKSARVVGPLTRAGFGFVEVGAATPRPQSGNPKPRLFRLTEDRAIINRFGFNNEGADAICARLANRPPGVPVGLNIGANKDSADRAADFAHVASLAAPVADFLTINVSSPNTEKLRDLQGARALAALIRGVLDARDASGAQPSVFVKIAPDLDEQALVELSAVLKGSGIDGAIATNTTLTRGGLTSRHAGEAGGLSGAPLFDLSTKMLARLYRHLGGSLPIIGVGGIGSVEQAWAKIEAGASAIQLYTALIYQGFSLADRIARGLDARLAAENTTLADLTGSAAHRWAA